MGDFLIRIIEGSMSGGFWRFLGYVIMVSLLIGVPIRWMVYLISRPFRFRTMMKHGYPPPHCDADGDNRDIES